MEIFRGEEEGGGVFIKYFFYGRSVDIFWNYIVRVEDYKVIKVWYLGVRVR